MITGTVVIAAHNEEAVIARTLDALQEAVEDGLRVIVVPNGCTDRTAEVAREHPGIDVAEIDVASKAAALREGDRRAGNGPRVYLDADIVLTSKAAADVVTALSHGAIAGRPPHVFNTSDASRMVRSWYRVRALLPSISSALWGAGCYGLSVEGRARFTEFPDIVSDDLFIDSQFAREEITIVDTDPVVVTTPRRLPDLIRILRRSYRTQAEIATAATGLSRTQRSQLADLRTMIKKSPQRGLDAVVYAAVIIYSRLRARTSKRAVHWERDVSSREVR